MNSVQVSNIFIYAMTVALIMVTKDIYLKNGILYFASQDEGYKCFEFSGRASVYEAVQQYSHVYIVCDNNNYFLYPVTRV